MLSCGVVSLIATIAKLALASVVVFGTFRPTK
jgi:hypothetical protein